MPEFAEAVLPDMDARAENLFPRRLPPAAIVFFLHKLTIVEFSLEPKPSYATCILISNHSWRGRAVARVTQYLHQYGSDDGRLRRPKRQP